MNINADQFLLQVFFQAKRINTPDSWRTAAREIGGAVMFLNYCDDPEARELNSDLRHAQLIALDRQDRLVKTIKNLYSFPVGAVTPGYGGRAF